jgi:hypothetical protein
MHVKPLTMVLLYASLACSVKTEQSADTSVTDRPVATATRPDSIIFVPGDPLVRGPIDDRKPQAPASASDSATSSAGTSFTITPNTYGPLRVGMTAAQAARALGGGFAAPNGYSGGCGYAVLVKAPSGLAVMLEDGKIARFEIRSGGIPTAAGARIGDTESRIKALYGSAVASTPHKYVSGGHYLTVTPPTLTDPAYRIVFETDGSKVTEYRSGKTPEVEQVERCG